MQSDTYPYIVIDGCSNPVSNHFSPRAAFRAYLRGYSRCYSISCADESALKELKAAEPEFAAEKEKRRARLGGYRPNAA